MQSESLYLLESCCYFCRFSHLHSYCNIIPYNIRIPQSNSLDYKMSPCWIPVTAIPGKQPLSPQ